MVITIFGEPKHPEPLRLRIRNWRRVVSCFLWACSIGAATAGVGTWTAIGPSVEANIVVDTATNDLYASSNNDGRLFRSGDFASTWTSVPPPPVADCSFFISALGNGALFALGEFPSGGPYDAANCQESHYKSTDRGASWTLLPPWPLLEVTTFDPTNPSILYGMYGGAYKSADGGMTWSLLPTGTPYPFGYDAIVVDTLTPSTLYVFGGKSNFAKSTDGGATWITANTGLPGAPNQPNSGIVGLVQVGSTLILGTDGSGIYRSTDGAATWAPANAGLPSLQLTGLVKGRESTPTLYALVNNGYSTTFFRSTDAATTWVPTGTLNAPSAGNLVFTPQSPAVAYASSAIGLFKSMDGTASWTRVPPTLNLPNDAVPILLGDSGDPSRLYVGTRPLQALGH